MAAEAEGGGEAKGVAESVGAGFGVRGLAAVLSGTGFTPPAGSRSRCEPSGTQ